ncbi:MAG: hypothetical protein K6F61_05095 [Clostridiales bacterium]|nr:hypothetical protein [Clostridiales bacterium]
MVNEKKKDEEQLAQRQAQQTYTPSAEVQQAQQQMQQQQEQKPAAYTPSETVTNAQQALQNVQNNKPASYNSKYGAALDNILQQIQNPGQFKYDFNGDELFKLYADQYTRRGKQASMDAMGQAAALTGGYGNTYAQRVGNQAYDEYLHDLYDKGLDLRDRAYQQYQDQLANNYNQFNVLSQADQTDYGRYRDLVGDWENERDYLTGRADTERSFDYNQYMDQYNQWADNRDYYTNLYNQLSQTDYNRYADARDFAEKQYQYDTNLQESIREFDASLNWDKMSSEQKYAAEYAMQILANGQMPSADLLQKAGLSAADAQKMMAKLKKGGSAGSSSSKKTYYSDMNGNLYEFDSKGNAKLVDQSKLKAGSYNVDTRYANLENNMVNGANNLAATVNNSQTVKDLQKAVSDIGGALGNMASGIGDFLGLNNKEDEKKKKQ